MELIYTNKYKFYKKEKKNGHKQRKNIKYKHEIITFLNL